MNLIEKLKNAPKGTKLYSLIFGEVKFEKIVDDCIFVVVKNKDGSCKSRYSFYSDGKYNHNGECVLFPSKENRDWNKFSILEKGHRVMCSDSYNGWRLGEYVDNNTINAGYYSDGTRMLYRFKYIVPIENFNFNAENLDDNRKYSMV